MAFVNHGKKDIKERLQKKLKESEKKSKSSDFKEDPRFLNYYNLKDGQGMDIILIPDDEGEYLYKFYMHGGYSDKIGSFPCRYKNEGKTCPICLRSYNELYQKSVKDPDGEYASSHFIVKTKILAQCIVIDSPIEVKDHGEDTIVHLIWLPVTIGEKIEESINEGIIQNELQDHILRLKKTEGANGRASYSHSFFRESIYQPDETMQEAIEQGLVKPWKLDEVTVPDTDETYVPHSVTEEEAEEWYEKSLSRIMGNNNQQQSSQPQQADDGGDSGEDDSQDDDPPQKTQEKPQEPSKQTSSSGGGSDIHSKLKARLQNRNGGGE